MADAGKLYVITPTGDRPEAFSLCVTYVNRQTRKPDMWVIVDDGKTDAVSRLLYRICVPYVVLRLDPIEENSVCRNIRKALTRVPDDAFVCVMEDDDWYPPEYLDAMYKLLVSHPVVASRNSQHYNVPARRYQLVKNNTTFPMHGNGFARDGLSAFRAFMQNESSHYADSLFSESWHGDRAFNDYHRVIHILGFGTGRSGTTKRHRVEKGESGWTDDPHGEILHEWIGDDILNYMPHDDAKVYIISNVDYPRDRRIQVDEKDLLVFLNKAKSVDYYEDHENKVIYHRFPEKPQYGEERLCVKNRYVYSAGVLGISEKHIQLIKSDYDFDYPIEKGGIKSPTTGYTVAQYMRHIYPLRDVILVNFGYDVAHSTFRSPWHNWAFEADALASFPHVFTTDVTEDKNPIPVRRKRDKSEYEQYITDILVDEGSDRTTSHDYGAVFAKYLAPLSHIHAKVIEIGGYHGSGIRALMRILPDAAVYGICSGMDSGTNAAGIVSEDGYSGTAWDGLPSDFDLIIDDGSHLEADMLRGIPTFVAHLKAGGVLMIEDVPSDRCMERLMATLPGGIRYDTARVSGYNDDRIFVYVKPES